MGYRLTTLLLYGALFSALVIVLRLLWAFPGAFLANRIRTRILHQKDKLPSARAILVTGWTGMRGVISLAAAIALPDPFPQRDLIIFLAFSVIFVTLVLQGLTLPFVVRVLGVASAGGLRNETEQEVLCADVFIFELLRLRRRGVKRLLQ